MACVVADLGSEVPMEDAFGVQVGHPAGDLVGQLHSHGPTQVFVALQKLLQVPTVDVLDRAGEGMLDPKTKAQTPSMNKSIMDIIDSLESPCFRWMEDGWMMDWW